MSHKTYIIAEAGVNHNGSIENAKALIDVASKAGADAVKFQTFKTENVISVSAPKADYQVEQTGAEESQYEMVKKLEFDAAAHVTLVDYANTVGIQFLSTAFDEDSLVLLTRNFDLPVLKIPSGEINNAPFLVKIAQTKKPIILSTGMATLGEIETALSILAFGYVSTGLDPSWESFQSAYASLNGQMALKKYVTILHCTTEYPAPLEEVNLRVMDSIAAAFSLPVGYSDHTQGITIPVAAVARGATMIEKHFTLDRNMEGPDHKASLEPDELTNMVCAIREVEKSLGQSVKIPTLSEQKNKTIARKSLVAKKAIKTGELFSEDNLTCKRPGNGISPLHFWDLLGKKCQQDYQADDLIRDYES